MVPLDLGSAVIRVPVADIKGRAPGKTLLVTAGVDGDEYASIDAAYTMIDEVNKASFNGRIIIIPIVNMPGYDKETSYNPLDGKYPKLVGVGKKDGTASEKLIHWLIDTYARNSDMWLDLHGGSLTEVIRPFLWSWETNVPKIDETAKTFCQHNSPDFTVFEAYSIFGKDARLAENGCAYIVGECGGSSVRSEQDTRQHCEWVRAAMERLSLVPETVQKIKTIPLYRKYREYTSTLSGVWYPRTTKIGSIKKGELLGSVKTYDCTKTENIVCQEDAQILWIKEGMKSSDKEILVAVAYA